jgi:hypothetical protein
MKSIINDNKGDSDSGLEALVMENGLRRRRTVYDEVLPLEMNDLDLMKHMVINTETKQP